jgi:hypothetical protein
LNNGKSDEARHVSDVGEIRALRFELLLRILIQNFLLLLTIFVLAVLGALGSIIPDRVWLMCAINAACVLATSSMWCHHGVRTMQLKKYILSREQERRVSWEVWLPEHRPNGILGTRWLISTKGVFVGSHVMLIVIACTVSPEMSVLLILFSIALLAITAALLVTNPKE